MSIRILRAKAAEARIAEEERKALEEEQRKIQEREKEWTRQNQAAEAVAEADRCQSPRRTEPRRTGCRDRLMISLTMTCHLPLLLRIEAEEGPVLKSDADAWASIRAKKRRSSSTTSYPSKKRKAPGMRPALGPASPADNPGQNPPRMTASVIVSRCRAAESPSTAIQVNKSTRFEQDVLRPPDAGDKGAGNLLRLNTCLLT